MRAIKCAILFLICQLIFASIGTAQQKINTDSKSKIEFYEYTVQKKYYGKPQNPILEDAKKLYLWLFPGTENEDELKMVQNSTPIRIVKNID